MSCHHLAFEERHYIETQWKLGISLKLIARTRVSTGRTSDGSFPKTGEGPLLQADRSQAQQRHVVNPKSARMTPAIKSIFGNLLREDCSPKQIAGNLMRQSQETFSHKTIDQYLLKYKCSGGNLYLQLYRHRK